MHLQLVLSSLQEVKRLFAFGQILVFAHVLISLGASFIFVLQYTLSLSNKENDSSVHPAPFNMPPSPSIDPHSGRSPEIQVGIPDSQVN